MPPAHAGPRHPTTHSAIAPFRDAPGEEYLVTDQDGGDEGGKILETLDGAAAVTFCLEPGSACCHRKNLLGHRALPAWFLAESIEGTP